MPETILIVDDDAAVAKVLGALLEQAGHATRKAASGEAALSMLERDPVDLIVTDLRMDGMDGMALLAEARARFPEIPVVMLTAHGTVPLAVEAMRAGAADFLLKPFDREEVVYTVRKALAGVLPQTSAPASAKLFGSTAAMKQQIDAIQRAAKGMATVLVRGESGTGKELAARALHDQGPRSKGPFVAVHCGALPETLLESELFGYEKGAFTGAASRKPGRVELASGGTLFLDEIGDVSLVVQAKLLRLLQEKTFERLGSGDTHHADVRFVAATHRPLEEMVAKGEFREDLFYRLNVVPIFLPPLRERLDEIEPLARQFCKEAGGQNGKADASLADEAVALLRAQPWPGNVRELQNFIERLVILSDGPVLGAADVQRELGRRPGLAPAAPVAPGATAGGAATLEGQRKVAEREAVQAALVEAKDNRSLAAKLLGVSRRTLYNKLEEHGLL